jgi:membrane-associated phospholipid phosphatase
VKSRSDDSIEPKTITSDQSLSLGSEKGPQPAVPSRRAFLKGLGAATLAGAVPAAAMAAGKAVAMPDVLSDTKSPQLNINARRNQAYQKRLAAAAADRKAKSPPHPNNGDETLFPNGIANFTKGFAHPQPCIVDPTIYAQYLAAIKSGKRADFDALVTGGVPLVDPQAGLAFDLETCDPSQNTIPPFATLTSKDFASQMVETYWLALTRDVPFSQWNSDPTIAAACTELSGLSAFTGPRINGQVTPQCLFRGFTPNDILGPYVSQFFIQPFTYGVMPFVGYLTTLPGDFATDPTSWASLQNGVKTSATENPDSSFKYLGDGRNLAEYVHNDVLYQEYLNAALMLATMGAPLNSGNPYFSLKSETGFITFGLPMVQVMVAEVIARAIKNAWFQKWFVHRMARPEETAGLVHYMKTQPGTNFFLDSSALNSQAAATVFSRTGNYFIPLSYPEGCPLHPSYPSGHATAAGAAVTILKWFFNESTPIAQLATPLITTDDGSKPVAYTGSDAGQLTVGGELNKLASNVGYGRVFSGIHWRDDIKWGMLLGEQIAINLLQDQAHLYNENYTGFTFTKFDGVTKVTV